MADSKRIQDNLKALAAIGVTPEGGVTRLAWSSLEREAHRLATRWMEEASLKVTSDAIGNTYGRREGSDPGLPTIMIGSHLDTVNNGGNLDGTLGMVGGLEVIRELNAKGVTTRHPITLMIFAAEEAVRFADTCMGSKLITGAMKRELLDQLKDAQGVSPAEAMRSVGFDPDRIEEARWDAASIAGYLELHIEQSTVLEKLGYSHNMMPSAAGHDARIMSFVTRTGMIFVPSKGGVSHNPKEYTAPEDILAGVNVLVGTVQGLDLAL